MTTLSEDLSKITNGEMAIGAPGPTRAGYDGFEGRPSTVHRARTATTTSANMEARIARLEYNVDQILELLIQQNQRQGILTLRLLYYSLATSSIAD